MSAHEWFIAAPPYMHASAGVVVLHRLCHKLRALGVDAYVATHVVHPAWNTPHKLAPSPGAVVVYPESIGGNPYGAQHVVRYVLFYPGRIGTGTSDYDDQELVAYYLDEYRIGPGPRVYVSAVDGALFFDTGERKAIDVVFVYKGGRDAAPWPTGATPMTHGWPETRAATAELLRAARRVYSYDTHSAVLLEAQMCGAEVYVPCGGQWVRHMPKPEPFGWDDLTEPQRLVDIARPWFRLG
jgi:hypothetical protein